jgi:hypothetical protein
MLRHNGHHAHGHRVRLWKVRCAKLHGPGAISYAGIAGADRQSQTQEEILAMKETTPPGETGGT